MARTDDRSMAGVYSTELRRKRRMLLVMCSSVLWLKGLASADTLGNPINAVQTTLERRVVAWGRRPDAAIPLLQLWGNWDRSTPAHTLARLQHLAADRRLSPMHRAHAAWLVGLGQLRSGNLQEPSKMLAALHFVQRWRVLGPFDNEGKAGFDTEFEPEKADTANEAPERQWTGKEQSVAWRPHPQADLDGFIDLGMPLRPREHVCALAETTLDSSRQQPMVLWLGAGGAAKLWWNGEAVFTESKYRQPYPDRHAVRVVAKAGSNLLRIKSCTAQGGRWGFYLRATPASEAPISVFEALQRAAAAKGQDAAAQEHLARFLVYTGADDSSEKRAEQLAASAAELAPNAERLSFAIGLATDRGDALRWARRAGETSSNDALTLLSQVRLMQQGPAFDGPRGREALALLDKIGATSSEADLAAQLRAEILAAAGFVETAAQTLRQAAQRADKAPGSIRQLAAAEEAAGHRDRALELRARAVQQRFDDFDSRRLLIDDAVVRGALDDASGHLQAMRQLRPLDVGTALYIAAAYESLNKVDMAQQVLDDVRTAAPRDADVHLAQGKMLLRAGQHEAALQRLREAVKIRPQAAEARELIEHLRAERRADEAFAVAPATFLRQRQAGRGYAATLLQDLTAHTVYESGLKSSFRQLVVQIHNEEGAQRWNTYPIVFDPGSQRIDVRASRIYRKGSSLEATQSYERSLSEPWYRIYYDRRARVLVFPALRPGDVLELRYRVEDVAPRNMLADYFGDLRLLQNEWPTRHFEYVVVMPKARPLYRNQPPLAGLRHQQTRQDDQRLDRWTAQDIPALQRQDSMPGPTQTAPFLHVSSYRDWPAVGRWYWGLVRDQLYADDSLRRQVRALLQETGGLQGIAATREKVARIHNWVVQNTRYVALEFGIHGYLPYRVPQVVRRGFGDCKDKAALLYTMLAEAGIEAQLALLRTRDNGDLAPFPASLAAFDHAIVYVPSLNLFLDGTAEFNGTAELPFGDQGALTLLVGPKGSELRHTPVLSAASNLRQRRVHLQLGADGDAILRLQEQLQGDDAAAARQRFAADGTRSDRLESSLRGLFPGLRLKTQQFSALRDLEKPVTVELQATVPRASKAQQNLLELSASAVVPLLPALARAASRVYDLELGAPRVYEEDRTWQLPAKMSIQQLPPSVHLPSPFGELRQSCETAAGGKAIIHTRLEIRVPTVPASQYGAFRAWLRQVDTASQQPLLVRRGSGSRARPAETRHAP